MALVLGATGGVGGETARALRAHGWHVRALARNPPRSGDGIEWIVGDAMDAKAVSAAANGVHAIVHAVNPPGYRRWGEVVMPMLRHSLAAAQKNGARMVLPGTIYNYSPAETPVADPDSPQRPNTRKGRIRMEMEKEIKDSGVRALILRCGDYFGPRAGNNWLAQGLITPGKPVTTITYPGKKDVGHAWAYLPDVGEAFARLLDKDEQLPHFARYHFAGEWDPDGNVFVSAITRAVGKPDIKIKGMPWGLLPIGGVFNTTLKELTEMKPFWDHPVRLDNTSLEAAIGPEPHTPLAEAMVTALRGLGCIA